MILKLDRSQIHIIKEQLYKAYKLTADKGHRNLNWFDTLIADPFNKEKYSKWYIIPDVAFATVQSFGSTQRLLTRYFDFSWYSIYPGRKLDRVTPAVELLNSQLDDFDQGFVSLEYMKRKKLIKKTAEKYNMLTNKEWVVPNGMFKTCNHECAQCWQHITFTGSKPELESISYEEWNRRFQP